MNQSQVKALIPGIKHFQTGKTVLGLVWLLFTVSFYIPYIFPGLVLHIIYLFLYCRQEMLALIKSNPKGQEKIIKVQEKLQALQQTEQYKQTVQHTHKVKEVAQQTFNEYQNNVDIQNIKNSEKYITENKLKQAILALEAIKPNSTVYQEAQEKLKEYKKAFYLYSLEDASEKINQNKYSEALIALKEIPENSDLYEQAQQKIFECEEELKKQAIEKENLLQQKRLDRENFIQEIQNNTKAIVFQQKATYQGGIKGYPHKSENTGNAYVLKDGVAFYDKKIIWKILYKQIIKAELAHFQISGGRAIWTGGDTGTMLQNVKNNVTIHYLDEDNVERIAKFHIHGALFIADEAAKAEEFLNHILDFKGQFFKDNISSTQSNNDFIKTLEKLKQLKDQGVISQAEFEAKKQKIIDQL